MRCSCDRHDIVLCANYPDRLGILTANATTPYFSAKHLGEGQYYLMTIKDKAGNDLDGAKSYRLHVPPDPPVRLYWSATVYDRATHALITRTCRIH